VSWAKDVYEAVTGKNLVTGDELDRTDYVFAVIGAVTLGIGSKAKVAKEAIEVVHDVGVAVLRGEQAADAARIAERARDAAADAEKIFHSAKKFEVPEGKIKDFVTELASPKRKRHILHGDETGGGHMFPGKPGKTVFPESWSGDKILHETSDIITDPAIKWTQVKGANGEMFTRTGKPSRWVAIGIRDGVEIRVVVEPAGEGIISSYPLSGVGVITNP
jgi:filamentous hemagglutinin